MALKNKQKEEISELYSFGYFMNHIIEKRTDLDGNPLSDETILLLIDAESNLDLFTKMEEETSPCEMCGSHGTIKVFLGETPIIIGEW